MSAIAIQRRDLADLLVEEVQRERVLGLRLCLGYKTIEMLRRR